MDTEVLEAIIKDDAVDATCFEDVPTEPVSIHPDRHDGPRTTLRDQEGLVPGFLRCRDDPAPSDTSSSGSRLVRR